MKLKQKLAEDFSEQYPIRGNCFGSWTDIEEAQIDCFLAGFEKAREMAIYEYSITSSQSLVTRLVELGEEDV